MVLCCWKEPSAFQILCGLDYGLDNLLSLFLLPIFGKFPTAQNQDSAEERLYRSSTVVTVALSICSHFGEQTA